KATREAVKKWVKDGYNIKAILISNTSVFKNAYADLKTISKDAGGAPIYAHPMTTVKEDFTIKDITAKKNELFKSFGLTIFNLPGNGGGSVLIYSDINEGMLFTGEDALGSPYDSELNEFTRPQMKSKNDEYGLAQSWSEFEQPFSYLFSLCGKPGYDLEEEDQSTILNKLSRIQE
ncbi:MAG: MBL fold metallo-hydrolase, partial [Gillisia sp.]|nr:MBL fold metallo-hydrolase [Gillisia sp.]